MGFIKKSLIILLLIYSAQLLPGAADDNVYKLEYGLLSELPSGDYEVRERRSTIELITSDVDPSYKFGYVLDTGKEESYCHEKLTFPAPNELKINSDKVAEGYYNTEIDDVYKNLYNITISTKKRACPKIYGAFQFGVGDKTGIYLIEIYIDDKLFRTIKFNVVDSNKEQ